MQALYAFIKEYPALVTWAFALVNAPWAVFIYFNNHRYECKLAKLRVDFDIEADRRKKAFERRATKYDAYIETLDALSKQSSRDVISNVMQIIGDLSMTLSNMLQSESGSREQLIIQWAEKAAITCQHDNDTDRMVRAASNQLKLIASEEVLVILAKIEDYQRKLNSITKEFWGCFPDICRSIDKTVLKRYSEELQHLDEKIKSESNNLMSRMRVELTVI